MRFREGDVVVCTDPDTGRWCRVRLTSGEGRGVVVGVVVRRGTVLDARRGELWEVPESWLTLLVESGAHVVGVTLLVAVASWVTSVWMLTGGGTGPGLVVLGVAVVFTVACAAKVVGVVTTVHYARSVTADKPGADGFGDGHEDELAVAGDPVGGAA